MFHVARDILLKMVLHALVHAVQVMRAIEPRMQLLVRELLAGAGGALPPSRIPSLASTLFAVLLVRVGNLLKSGEAD